MHWQDKHATEYAKVMKWLGETDAKIRAAEILAHEGMKGPGVAEAAPNTQTESEGTK